MADIEERLLHGVPILSQGGVFRKTEIENRRSVLDRSRLSIWGLNDWPDDLRVRGILDLNPKLRNVTAGLKCIGKILISFGRWSLAGIELRWSVTAKERLGQQVEQGGFSDRLPAPFGKQTIGPINQIVDVPHRHDLLISA